MSDTNQYGNAWKPGDDKKFNAPQPLFRELPPAKPYPLDALGGLLCPAAKAINEAIQAPGALCGQSLLGAAALAVQPHANVYMDGRTKPTSLFLLTVGQSGERKSAVDAEALQPHREVEAEKIEQCEAEQKIFERDFEAWETAKRNALRGPKKTKADFAKALNELGPKPEPPPSEIMIMDEPTLEGMQKALAYGRPSIGIFSDEGGRMVGGHGMSADNQLKTAAGLCLLWDGSAMTRVRAGDGATKHLHKRLSVHLMFQPRVAEQLTGNQMLLDQGLLARCLIAAPETTVGTRAYKNIDLGAAAEVIRYRKKMREILEVPMPISSQKKNELNPRKLELAPDIKNLWILFHNHIEGKMKDGGEFSPVRGFACKAAEQTLRIAGVLTLVDDLYSEEIRHEHLESAIALMEFYLSEALRLYNSAVLNPDLVQAQKLLSWCQQYREIYPTKIYQLGPNAFREKAVAIKFIRILEEHNWLRRLQNGKEIDGKYRKDAWEVIS